MLTDQNDLVHWLSKAFGSTPETWLQMQFAYDLDEARKHEDKINVRYYLADDNHAH